MESQEAPQETSVDCTAKPSSSNEQGLQGDNDTTNSGSRPIPPPRRRMPTFKVRTKQASDDVRRIERNLREISLEMNISLGSKSTFRVKNESYQKQQKVMFEQHEVMECEPEENEGSLATYLTTCQKNPDHTGFIPFKDFSVEHITITNSIDELYNMIKFTADLTVRIAVPYTSIKRPSFVPDTNALYPCSHLRGKSCLRIGTGMITGISKYQDEEGNTCQCKGCKKSDTPQTTWWSVGVMTATHVVFDDSEAESATCRLFFDQADSPVVTLDGWRMWDMSIKGDTCRFSCASHDMELYEKVQKMYNSYLYCPHKFEEGVSFIVSHPHGCFKQVSVGKYKQKHIKHLQL